MCSFGVCMHMIKLFCTFDQSEMYPWGGGCGVLGRLSGGCKSISILPFSFLIFFNFHSSLLDPS